MYLHFTIKSSFFNEIDYWTWGDFRKQFRHGGQSNTKTIITSICKGNTNFLTTIISIIHLPTKSGINNLIRLKMLYGDNDGVQNSQSRAIYFYAMLWCTMLQTHPEFEPDAVLGVGKLEQVSTRFSQSTSVIQPSCVFEICCLTKMNNINF